MRKNTGVKTRFILPSMRAEQQVQRRPRIHLKYKVTADSTLSQRRAWTCSSRTLDSPVNKHLQGSFYSKDAEDRDFFSLAPAGIPLLFPPQIPSLKISSRLKRIPNFFRKIKRRRFFRRKKKMAGSRQVSHEHQVAHHSPLLLLLHFLWPLGFPENYCLGIFQALCHCYWYDFFSSFFFFLSFLFFTFLTLLWSSFSS